MARTRSAAASTSTKEKPRSTDLSKGFFAPQTSEEKSRVQAQEQARASGSSSQSGLTFEGMRTEVNPSAHAQVQEAIKNNATSDQIRAIIESNRLAPSTVAPQLTDAQEAQRQQRQEQINQQEQGQQQSPSFFNNPEISQRMAAARGEQPMGKNPLAGTFGEGVKKGLGVGLGVSAGVLGADLLVSGGLTSALVSRAAAGKVVSRFGTGTLINSVKASKTVSYLSKVASSAKRPSVVVGLIGGYLFEHNFSLNERSDALTTLSIALRDAEKAGDKQIVAELHQLLQDVASPSMLEKYTPLFEFYDAEVNKWAALRKSAELANERMNRI